MKSQNKLDTLSVDPYFSDNEDTIALKICIYQTTLLPQEVANLIADYGYTRQLDVSIRLGLVAELTIDIDYILHIDGMIYTVKCLTPTSVIQKRSYKWDVLETFHVNGKILGIDFIEISPSMFRFVIAISDVTTPLKEFERIAKEDKDTTLYTDDIILTDMNLSIIKMCHFGQNRMSLLSESLLSNNFRRMIIDRKQERIMLFCNFDNMYTEYDFDLKQQSLDGIEKDPYERRSVEKYAIHDGFFVTFDSNLFFFLNSYTHSYVISSYLTKLYPSMYRDNKRMSSKDDFVIVDHESTSESFKLVCMLGSNGILRIKTFDINISNFISPELDLTLPDKFEPFSMSYYNGVIELCGTIQKRNVVLLYR
jgi:hypothetical protein